MIKIKLLGVYNIKYAILGMQNHIYSWHLTDSSELGQAGNRKLEEKYLNLAQRLTLAGPDNCRFLRFITVCFDLIAPLYWWREFDTYKFKETNSSPTMHKLTSKYLAPHDFPFDYPKDNKSTQILNHNNLSTAYNSQEIKKEEDNESRKAIFRKHTQNFPNTYMQKRTVITNYAELRNIYFQHRKHKLDEWGEFCDWIKETLPYAEDLICLEKS